MRSSFTRVVVVLCVAVALLPARPVALAQRPAVPFPSYHAFIGELESVAALEDEARRDREIDALWRRLQALGQIPFRHEDRVAFLYRDEEGSLTEAAWSGDMTGWDVVGSHIGRRVGRSHVWMLEDVLPRDARVDYRLVLNGHQWQVDAANPRQQASAGGVNSELRMPGYRPPLEVEPREGVAQGTLGERRLISSKVVDGYQTGYRVYTPASRGDLVRMPVVYFTDGEDYVHPELGGVTTILDNRIADGGLPPFIAVFLDPHDPETDKNRREAEYGSAPADYARVLVEDLVPEIDRLYPTLAEPSGRVVVGNSLGGLFAAHVVLHESETFGGALIQSPAFEYEAFLLGNRLRGEFRDESKKPVRIFINVGTLFDDLAYSRGFHGILTKKDYAARLVEVHEGHSWGQWKAFIDDGLAYLLDVDVK